MAEGRRVRVFLNSGSGSGDADAERLCAMFRARDCQCDVTVLTRSVDLEKLAASDGADVAWIAAGGDGTVNCVANAVAGTERLMGVLPLGTLNHFAQDLDLPMGLEDAVEVATRCKARRMDAAEVDGRIFVNNSSLGVYPAMVLDRERMKKGGWNKWWSLVVASARAFARFRCLEVELEADGQTRRFTTPLLFAGNNAYSIEGGKLGRRERLDAGVLSLFVVPHASRTAMLRLLVSALAGRVREAGHVEEFVVSRFTVRSRHQRLRVSLDGEVKRMPPPLHYKIRPGELRVIAPDRAAE